MGKAKMALYANILFLFFVVNCNHTEPTASKEPFVPNQSDNEQEQPIVDSTRPVLYNLCIDFEPYDTTNQSYGDFIFSENGDDKDFLEFGAIVDGGKLLATFEYRISADADVKCPINGVVAHSEEQSETNDYEIWLRPSLNSIFTVSIDHVSGATVNVGDTVVAGQILGRAGYWYSPEGNVGRVELQISEVLQDIEIFHNPIEFLAADSQSVYEQRIWNFIRDWEQMKGDTTIYDEAAMVYAGCNAYKYCYLKTDYSQCSCP